jgi:hypothetical protein
LPVGCGRPVSSSCLVGLEVVRRHAAAVAAVDDHRFVDAEALRRACRVHRGIAAAVDGDAAPELRYFALLGAGQEADGVEDLAGFAARDVDLLADVRTYRDEHGIEAAFFLFGEHVIDPMVERDLHPHVLDAFDLGLEFIARHAVGRDAEMDHAARDGPCLADLDFVAEPDEMVGRRQPARSGADDEDLPAAGLLRLLELPPFLQGKVAQEAFDGMDTDSAVRECAIAHVFTGVIADAAVDRGQRIIPHEFTPGALEVAGLRQRQPRLDVLASRAGVIAGRQKIDVLGPLAAQRACTFIVAREVRALCQIGVTHDWMR